MKQRQRIDASEAEQRLAAMAKTADPEGDFERFEDAEAVVAAYERAVKARAPEQLPGMA